MTTPGSSQPVAPLYSRWTSPAAFVLAAVGAGMGLGNIWRFPYVTGFHGGGAFVVVYILAAFGIVMPVLVAELMIGRRGGGNPMRSIAALAREVEATSAWRFFGAVGMVATFLVFAYTSVFASWALPYMLKAASGKFTGAAPQAVRKTYDALLGDPLSLMGWHGAFLVIVAVLVAQGLREGLERAFKVLIPFFLIVLVGLVIYAGLNGAFMSTVHFLLRPQFTGISPGTVLTAVGSAFLTVTVGLGIMMTFGAYLDRDVNITRAAVVIVAADVVVSLLSAFAVFPIVFAYQLNPAEGPGLVFVTMTTAFAAMPGGAIIGTLFFLFLMLAALTSAIAAMQPLVRWAMERHGWQRSEAGLGFAAAAWLLGIAIEFSFNIGRDFYPLARLPWFQKETVFQLVDRLTSDALIPFAGVSLLIFSGWRLTAAVVQDELSPISPVWFQVWRFLVRWLAPATLLIIGALVAFR
jgi:NSS family neurotransmitter:Na+ symporter